MSVVPVGKILAPAHWVGAGSLLFVLRSRRTACTAIMVLANAEAMHVALLADDEATHIRLCSVSLSLLLSSLGG